jgi:hypothetical protein
MGQRILNIIAIFCIVNAQNLSACGWSENSETVRLALFRAEMSGMPAFRPFYYSANYFNDNFPDPEGLDQVKNCVEWQKKLGTDVSMSDINTILYQTEPGFFELARQNLTLIQSFPENTFIKKLLLKQNLEILKYITFAKSVEYTSTEANSKWESWDDKRKVVFNYIGIDSIAAMKDKFLQRRYAFLMMRVFFYSHSYHDVFTLYNQYFEKKTGSIIDTWALLFKAMALDNSGDKLTANYLYSIVFDQSDEKKLIALQCFNSKMLNQTLSIAKSTYEKAVIKAMVLLRNPGPALVGLQEIEVLAPDNKYLAPLIMREINKIEDWIFTPKFTQYGPSINYNQDKDWDYFKVKNKNYQTDTAYLNKFIGFLQKCQLKAKGELRDFLSISIAHLYFINDNNRKGQMYLDLISRNASPSIAMQKYIDAILVELKTGDVTSETLKNKILVAIQNLEKAVKSETNASKSLYSLLRIVGGEYEKHNDFATAGLLFLRSEYYKNQYEFHDEYFWGEQWYYWYIGYFDRHATISDMDKLLDMIGKKQKTPFETYLCSQPLASQDVYKDLKGTIAFRNNDLELAYQTFYDIPDSFWTKNYEFRYYLKRDPFTLPVFDCRQTVHYSFTKTKFVKELIDLKKNLVKKQKNQADLYLKLANAYYNCSYYGNSWMMINYGKGVYDGVYSRNDDYLFGPIYDKMNLTMQGNYYHCNIAQDYYKKALQTTSNKEQRALILYMLHNCEYTNYILSGMEHPYTENNTKFQADQYLRDFYLHYQNTDAFAELHCPLLDYFAGYKL